MNQPGVFICSCYACFGLRTFVLALGKPPPHASSSSVLSRLFVPLVVPCLALAASVAFVHYQRRWGNPPTDPDDLAAGGPLIEPLSPTEEVDNGAYRDFDWALPVPRSSYRRGQGDSGGSVTSAPHPYVHSPPSSYGAI